VVRYAAIPQIVPDFLSFIIYHWDVNVRISTIIGFVGGGGIGYYISPVAVRWKPRGFNRCGGKRASPFRRYNGLAIVSICRYKALRVISGSCLLGVTVHTVALTN
jgi:hypothetical protein